MAVSVYIAYSMELRLATGSNAFCSLLLQEDAFLLTPSNYLAILQRTPGMFPAPSRRLQVILLTNDIAILADRGRMQRILNINKTDIWSIDKCTQSEYGQMHVYSQF